jgi:hypothetical protein
VWVAASGSFLTSPALSIDGTTIVARPPDLEIGGTVVRADLGGEPGGLRYLGHAADGTIAVVREEAWTTETALEVLQTVEWYSPAGEFLASARVPDLAEQAIGAPPGVAILPDGDIVALVAHTGEVQVVVLTPVSARITGRTGSV